MKLTERQAKVLRQALRAESRLPGTGFPMPRDLLRQLERKGLMKPGEHEWARQAYGKVIARIPMGHLTNLGCALASKSIAETSKG